MAKKNYYGVKVGKKVGVFDNWNDTSLQVIGFKGAQFKGFATKAEAYNYVGLPIEETNIQKITSKNKNTSKSNSKQKKKRNLIDEYRRTTTNKERLKFVSSLSDEDKNILYAKMSLDEISHYKKIASDLMERRFNTVIKHKKLLDYLTTNPKDVQYSLLNSKYSNVDLSIPIYTIKAIINVMGESNFSKDDGSSYYNKNSENYYRICKKYWNNIWWDTDTGHLSKEEIAARRFSEYHKNCNKIKTIAEIRRHLDLLYINYFSIRYKLPELQKRLSFYTTQKAIKH